MGQRYSPTKATISCKFLYWGCTKMASTSTGFFLNSIFSNYSTLEPRFIRLYYLATFLGKLESLVDPNHSASSPGLVVQKLFDDFQLYAQPLKVRSVGPSEVVECPGN